MARAKKKQELGGLAEWIVTYGDMVTLLLCFFVALFDTTDADVIQINQMISSLNNIGMGASPGGNTLSAGKMAELGNSIATLPSMERGRLLATAKRKAVSLFQPEIKSNKVRISSDERGLVISLASDAFFRPASAAINIEETRGMLIRISELLKSPELEGRKFRIEGHTDTVGPAEENRLLSERRANAVRDYLVERFGIAPTRLVTEGLGESRLLVPTPDETPQQRNRRVQILNLGS